MPLTDSQAAYLTTASQLANTGLNVYGAAKLNKKTMKFSERMYDRQRADALADWEMQNSYNSPRAQMQRFREAGLNPHLIYGQQNEGATVRSSQAPSWNPERPEINLDARPVLGAYYDVKMKEASLDTMAHQQDIMKQDKLLRQAQILSTLEGTTNMKLRNEILSESGLETAEARLDNIKAQTTYTLNRNEREEAMNSSNLREAAERIIKLRLEQAQSRAQTINIKANTAKTREETKNLDIQRDLINSQIETLRTQLKGIDQDQILKEYDIHLREMGLDNNSPIAIKMLIQYLDRVKQGKGRKIDWKEVLSPRTIPGQQSNR